jgi:hypothetical protein
MHLIDAVWDLFLAEPSIGFPQAATRAWVF